MDSDSTTTYAMNSMEFALKTAIEYKIFDLVGHQLGKIRLNGASVEELKAGLKNAGFHQGVFVIRSTFGRTLRIDLRR